MKVAGLILLAGVASTGTGYNRILDFPTSNLGDGVE